MNELCETINALEPNALNLIMANWMIYVRLNLSPKTKTGKQIKSLESNPPPSPSLSRCHVVLPETN